MLTEAIVVPMVDKARPTFGGSPMRCLAVVALFLAVPAVFWYRLRRVRRRRRQLIRSEWTVEPEPDWKPTSARGTM